MIEAELKIGHRGENGDKDEEAACYYFKNHFYMLCTIPC